MSPADAHKATYRVAELLKEAAEVAATLRGSGPADGRFEAGQLIAAISDADEIRRDLGLLYRENERQEIREDIQGATR